MNVFVQKNNTINAMAYCTSVMFKARKGDTSIG